MKTINCNSCGLTAPSVPGLKITCGRSDCPMFEVPEFVESNATALNKKGDVMKWLRGYRCCWLCTAACMLIGVIIYFAGGDISGWISAVLGWSYAAITEWQRENYV